MEVPQNTSVQSKVLHDQFRLQRLNEKTQIRELVEEEVWISCL
jgi:hypothetical protein